MKFQNSCSTKLIDESTNRFEEQPPLREIEIQQNLFLRPDIFVLKLILRLRLQLLLAACKRVMNHLAKFSPGTYKLKDCGWPRTTYIGIFWRFCNLIIYDELMAVQRVLSSVECIKSLDSRLWRFSEQKRPMRIEFDQSLNPVANGASPNNAHLARFTVCLTRACADRLVIRPVRASINGLDRLHKRVGN